MPEDPAAEAGADEPAGEAVAGQAVAAEVVADDNGDGDSLDGSKLMRIGSMTKAMLNEARQAPLDEAGRRRLQAIHTRSMRELCEVLPEELRDELGEIFVPLEEGSVATESELRIAQAQLVGWLEGLFNGIQAALFTQQMAARSQLEQMRGRRELEAPGDDDRVGGVYL